MNSCGKFEGILFNKTVKSNNTDFSEDGLVILTPCMLSYVPTLILRSYTAISKTQTIPIVALSGSENGGSMFLRNV